MSIVNQERFLRINRHRSCDIDMKSSVYPTPIRGDLTGQGEIKTYLALLCGNHRLVPLLARHSSKTRDLRRVLIHLGGILVL